MSAPESLKEVYTDEMKDLWSANDQMTRAMKTMAAKAHDPKLKQMLEESVTGIGKHSEALKTMVVSAGGEPEPEHCKGMEGLVKEALKHTTREAPENGDLLDIVIVSQYQRMCHYGIAGFGAAASYAGALGMADEAGQLKAIVADIYKADKYATKLSEKAGKLAPKDD